VSGKGNEKIGEDKGLPVIKCSVCGEKIMLVPNVKLMSEAIEAHVETHKVKVKDRKAADTEAERIRDDLIKQVLNKSAKA
jgi:DNA-directed RNA polymerase subunit RPC12/RpoP